MAAVGALSAFLATLARIVSMLAMLTTMTTTTTMTAESVSISRDLRFNMRLILVTMLVASWSAPADDQTDAYRGLAARALQDRERQYGLDARQLERDQQTEQDRQDQQSEREQREEDRQDQQLRDDGVQ